MVNKVDILDTKSNFWIFLWNCCFLSRNFPRLMEKIVLLQSEMWVSSTTHEK